MTDVDFTDIDGVGPSRSDTLEEAGYETFKDVAEENPGDIEETLGPAVSGEDIKLSARDLMVEEETDESDPREETTTLMIPNRELVYYLVKGLADENIRLRKRNEYEEVEEVNELVERLLDRVEENGGGVVVDLDDLSFLYTAVRNIEQEIRNSRGISDLVGTVRNLRGDIQDCRQELWPDSD